MKHIATRLFELYQAITNDGKWVVIKCVWDTDKESWYYCISNPGATRTIEYREEDLKRWVDDYNNGVVSPSPCLEENEGLDF